MFVIHQKSITDRFKDKSLIRLFFLAANKIKRRLTRYRYTNCLLNFFLNNSFLGSFLKDHSLNSKFKVLVCAEYSTIPVQSAGKCFSNRYLFVDTQPGKSKCERRLYGLFVKIFALGSKGRRFESQLVQLSHCVSLFTW